jgi:hypothetical protein
VTDQPPGDRDRDAGAARGPATPPRAPRWVKAFAVIAAIVVLLVAIMLLSGGKHRPGRHVGERPDAAPRAAVAQAVAPASDAGHSAPG